MNDEALIGAVDEGDLQAVRELLAAGADPNATVHGYTALYIAASEEHLAIVQELLAAGADPNAMYNGYTAIYTAAQRGNLAIVRKLLAAGADPNESFMIIFETFQSIDVSVFVLLIRELLAAGADPNIILQLRHRNGTTALIYAAMYGVLPVIRELIAWGADPTLADNRGRTPLDYPMVQQAFRNYEPEAEDLI